MAKKTLTEEELKAVTGGSGKTKTFSTFCSVCSTPVEYQAGDVRGEKKYFCPTCNKEYCVVGLD